MLRPFFAQSPLDDHNFAASAALQALDFRKSIRFLEFCAQPEAG
jgi:hypothetical protein